MYYFKIKIKVTLIGTGFEHGTFEFPTYLSINDLGYQLLVYTRVFNYI